MGRQGCSSCGGTGRVSRSRMGAMGYETYYETCMICSGRGYHITPDPPPPSPVRKKRPKRLDRKNGGGRTNELIGKSTPAVPKNETTFEGVIALLVTVIVIWLAIESGLQIVWWAWLLLFFGPLIGVNYALERLPCFSKALKKGLIWGAIIAVAGLILSSLQSSGG